MANSEATIDSPGIALADNGIGNIMPTQPKGAVIVNFGVSQLQTDGIDTVLVTSDGAYVALRSDGENSVIIASDGTIIASGSEATYDKFYEVALDRIKNDGENVLNPDIRDLTQEDVAESVRTAIIKQKMAEAVTMVCAYTNGPEEFRNKEYNIPAMTAAAEKVLAACKDIEHPSDLLSVDPMEYAVKAVEQHCPPDNIENIEKVINEHITFDEQGNVITPDFVDKVTVSGIVNSVFEKDQRASNLAAARDALNMQEPSGASMGHFASTTTNVRAPRVSQGAALA